MAQNKQLKAAAKVIDQLQRRIADAMGRLKKSANSLGSEIVTPKRRRDLVSSLERLRAALNSAILAMERSIGDVPKPRARRRKP